MAFKSPRGAKDKGTRAENRTVKWHTANDIPARRVPGSGALGGQRNDLSGDIDIGHHWFYKGENKVRATCQWKNVVKWIGDAEMLLINDSVILTGSAYLDIWKGKAPISVAVREKGSIKTLTNWRKGCDFLFLWTNFDREPLVEMAWSTFCGLLQSPPLDHGEEE